MLRCIVLEIETRAERRRLNKHLRAGMRGVREGYDPHILDVATPAKEAWENVSQMTLARCWMKASILPAGHSAGINASEGRMQNASKTSDVQEVMNMLRNLPITEDVQQEFSDTTLLNANAGDISDWFHIEESAEVREAMVEDAVMRIDELAITDRKEEPEEGGDEDGNAPDVAVVREVPSTSEIYALFQPLQNLAYDCNIPEAGAGLRRALNGFLSAIQQANAKKTRQVLIPEMLSRALPNSADSQ